VEVGRERQCHLQAVEVLDVLVVVNLLST